MDRDQLFQGAKYWYPVVAAILSSLLNFLAFMIAIKWDANAFVQISLLALLGTSAVSAGVILVLYKIGISGYSQDFIILSSVDDYQIIGAKKAIYKRTVKVKVNKPSTHYFTYPPTVDGELREFQAYNTNNPNIKYHVSVQKIGGRKALFLFLDHPLRKGEIIDGVCIECLIINSFEDEHEGIRVRTDPKQERCIVRASLPKECPPISLKAEWFVFYGQNQEHLESGVVDAHQPSADIYTITNDFSNVISQKDTGLLCALNWRWKPSQLPEAINQQVQPNPEVI